MDGLRWRSAFPPQPPRRATPHGNKLVGLGTTGWQVTRRRIGPDSNTRDALDQAKLLHAQQQLEAPSHCCGMASRGCTDTKGGQQEVT